MISVIIPIYNAEKYLDRCIQSVLSQTFKEIEIILVDDGSNDSSLQICQSYADMYADIKVIAQKNSGVSSARNAGIAKAKGEYVMFVDSDDYMLPEMCEIMVNAVKRKHADIVVCGTTETWGGLWAPQKEVDYYNLDSFKNAFIDHLTSELLSPPWNKIYKRNLIKVLFDTSISFGEDLIFNLRYLNNCQRISFITEAPFYHEKANDQSLVNRVYPSRLIEIEKVHSTVLEFYNGNDINIHCKYLRDVLVYSMAIVKNVNYSLREIRKYLDEWIHSSHLNYININKVSLKWNNKLLLGLLKWRMWVIVKVIIKYRYFFH